MHDNPELDRITGCVEVEDYQKIDISTFTEVEDLFPRDHGLVVQLKGFNREERVTRRHNQVKYGQSGSDQQREISQGGLTFISCIKGSQPNEKQISPDCIITCPDSRGMYYNGDYFVYASVNTINILDLKDGKVKTITNPYLAFIHSIREGFTSDSLLITSSGFDGILDIELNGVMNWSWFAWNNGYKSDLLDFNLVNPNSYQSGLGLPPNKRVIFPNSAIDWGDYILITSFHKGLCLIEKTTGILSLVDGDISNPHAIKKLDSGGIVVTDTSHGRCIFYNQNLKKVSEVIFSNLDGKDPQANGMEWLQYVSPFEKNLFIAIDSNRTCIIIFSISERTFQRISIDPSWVAQEVMVLPVGVIETIKNFLSKND